LTPRVVYWNNIPAPYMVERFDAVARRGRLNFEAWFSARTEKDRSWRVDERAWRFRHRYLPCVSDRVSSLALPTPLLRGAVPDVLVSLYAAPSFLLGSAIAARRGARTAFWVEVTFDAWIKRSRWKEAVKSVVLPRADAILTAGNDGRDFALRYGASPDRIISLPHVIDFRHYAEKSSFDSSERNRVRENLGLRGVTFAYVGRLWLGKGLDYLVDAFDALQRSVSQEVSLLMVGDGVHEQVLRARCEQNRVKNVVFAGFHDAESLPRIYAAADVFVFPTLGDPFGMVVLEAMACGLPVISTSASGEIRARVSDGVNGFIVAPADSAQLHERMALLAGDAELRRRMGDASRAKVAGQSPDDWAQGFEDAIDRILEFPCAPERR
jgi:glycosyltransferase involved in cell wall biosynthesis